MRRRLMLPLLPVVVLAVGIRAEAYGHGDAGCVPAACEERVVHTTVYMPTWTTEKRTIQCVEYRNEERQRTVTYYERVLETKTVTREYTVLVREVMSREEKYIVCKPVWREETREYTVMVPRLETRTGTRTVCKPVWTEQTREYTVMVPHTETRTATRVVCKPVWKEMTREYTVMVPHVETRQGTPAVQADRTLQQQPKGLSLQKPIRQRRCRAAQCRNSICCHHGAVYRLGAITSICAIFHLGDHVRHIDVRGANLLA